MHSTRPSSPQLAPYFPLLWRLAGAAGVITAEFVLRSALSSLVPLYDAHRVQLQGLFSFAVAWPAILVILAVTDASPAVAAAARRFAGAPVHLGWAALHLVLVLPLVWPPTLQVVGLNSNSVPFFPYVPHLIAPLAALALLLGLAPLDAWRNLVRSTGKLPLLALAIAATATLTIQAARLMWEPATAVTFWLVKTQLLPFFPGLQVFPADRILATPTLEVTVAPACSGLEGVGLILVFCAGWLWHLRRDFRFPRALLIVPMAAVAVFGLNSVRISALFALAEAGFAEVAAAGFHSQAGWIFFNVVALLVAIVSRKIAWLQNGQAATAVPVATEPAVPERSRENPVAPYLLPLLAILAAGMLATAISAGFESLYGLRLVAAAGVLLVYRKAYEALDWRFGWRAIAGGVLVFGVWLAGARWLLAPAGMPAALVEMSPAMRLCWIVTRFVATAITVPIAEELAFRGFLLRRFTTADFTSITLRETTAVALVVSSVVFGITHGSMWVPGIFAGLVFGGLARSSSRIGDAVVAHATTNALLAVLVIWFGQWQFW